MTGISGQNFGVTSPLPLMGLSPAELMRAGTLISDHPQVLNPGTEFDLFSEDTNGTRVATARVVKSTAAIALDSAGNNSQRIVSAALSAAAKMDYSDGLIGAYTKSTKEPAGIMLGGYTEKGAASTTTTAGDNMIVIARGIVQVRAGAILAVGAKFKSDAAGKAVAAVAGDRAVGYVLTAAAGANSIFWAYVDCVGVISA